MFWNYRVVKRTYSSGEQEYAIYEVYYKEGKPSMVSVDPDFPYGQTVQELNDAMVRYLDALNKPILNYEDF